MNTIRICSSFAGRIGLDFQPHCQSLMGMTRGGQIPAQPDQPAPICPFPLIKMWVRVEFWVTRTGRVSLRVIVLKITEVPALPINNLTLKSQNISHPLPLFCHLTQTQELFFFSFFP